VIFIKKNARNLVTPFFMFKLWNIINKCAYVRNPVTNIFYVQAMEHN